VGYVLGQQPLLLFRLQGDLGQTAAGYKQRIRTSVRSVAKITSTAVQRTTNSTAHVLFLQNRLLFIKILNKCHFVMASKGQIRIATVAQQLQNINKGQRKHFEKAETLI